MKKILIPIGALLISGLSQAQLTTTENYVYSKTYLDYNSSGQPTKSSETVQYFDGLGRPKQVVNIKASPAGKDVVTHIEYDGFGRQVKDYLPVPQQGTQNGGIYTSPLSNATQPTLYGSEKIFSEKILESSPLDRILQQKQVGNAWDTKPVQFGYDANTAEDAVKKYTTASTWVNGATSSQISQSTNYLTAQLYKNTVTDEDGNQTIEFKNGEGQVLLVRKMLSATEKVDTYYVYNEYNQLAYVIPPLASNVQTLSASDLDNLCYQYKYDGRNRLVEKKLPGKGWEYMVYDKQDRLVMTQDANMGGSKQWLFTKYDQFGRIVYTGIYTSAENYGSPGRVAEQGYVDSKGSNNVTRSTAVGFSNSGTSVYYDNAAASNYPNTITKLLSVNYYDSYPAGSPAVTNAFTYPLLTDSHSTGISTKGLPVAGFVKNIENDEWTKSYTWYDTRGRSFGGRNQYQSGGYTVTNHKMDFSGAILQTSRYHRRMSTDPQKVVTEKFTYDSQNRLLTHTHQVDSNPVEYLARNTYNELSQLSGKKVGGASVSTPLQDISYKYNIRGWMTQINDPNNLGNNLFGYKIKYNEVEGLQTPDTSETSLQVIPKYNGNIAEVDWKTSTQENEPLKRYGYVYDGLNRLSAGFYQNDTNPSIREYYEKVTYDLNGNIKTMKRTAQKLGTTVLLADNLTYDYENNNLSNRLKKVSDAAVSSLGFPYKTDPSDIGYDSNGNMTSFPDKNISSIEYNYLNLPKKITQNAQVTDYVYRGDGVKIKKLFGGLQTDYLDGFQYKFTYAWEDETGTMTNNEIKLRIIPTSEGYYDTLLGLYVYNYVDHLGNVRIGYADSDHDGTIRGRDTRVSNCYPTGDGGMACTDSFIPGEIVSNNTYYPFGMLFDHNAQAMSENAYKYKYNSKELQETGMYDYGARFYMPDIGRWGVVDSKGAEFPGWSPYNYSFNNPIRFIDPDGNAPSDIVFINNRGVEVHRIKSDTQFKTYIQATTNASSDPAKSTAGWKQVPMPNIIQNKGGEDVSGPAYQENDYQIAARTGYFNQVKNSGQLDLVTEGANPIPQDAIKGIPDLDPTLVKAITVQESNAGTSGITDIMQANVPGDWSKMKSEYGLTKGAKTDESTSLFAGTRILGTKGFKGGVSYDSKTGKSTYKFQGWAKAVEGYNGGGTAGYQKRVLQMQQESKKPKPSDY